MLLILPLLIIWFLLSGVSGVEVLSKRVWGIFHAWYEEEEAL